MTPEQLLGLLALLADLRNQIASQQGTIAELRATIAATDHVPAPD